MSNPHKVDKSHLNALMLNLSNERARFDSSKNDRERAIRAVLVKQLEREVEAERAFLGMLADPSLDLSDDELLADLEMFSSDAQFNVALQNIGNK